MNKENLNDLVWAALRDIIDDYDEAGCEDCGVVSRDVINKGRLALGLEPYES